MDFKVRDRSVNRGIRALTEEHRVYLQLVDQGVGYAETARIVGINVRTGKRWRNGRTASVGTLAALPIEPGPSDDRLPGK